MEVPQIRVPFCGANINGIILFGESYVIKGTPIFGELLVVSSLEGAGTRRADQTRSMIQWRLLVACAPYLVLIVFNSHAHPLQQHGTFSA